MKDIKLISGELWRLTIRLFILLRDLGRQVVLPTHRRSGNLLNTLFLFYIGVINNIQHLEYRQFKLAQLFQNKVVRKGLMLLSFLLFLLTSFEHSLIAQPSSNASPSVQCTREVTINKSAQHCEFIDLPVEKELVASGNLGTARGNSSPPLPWAPKLYLQNRRLLV